MCAHKHTQRIKQSKPFIHAASIDTHSAYKVTSIVEERDYYTNFVCVCVGGGEFVWLECKVATALQANVHAVRCRDSDQSLSTPSSPPTPSCSIYIQLYLIHWIQNWLNTVHVESQIIWEHFPTHHGCPQMGAHCNLPAGCAGRTSTRKNVQTL